MKLPLGVAPALESESMSESVSSYTRRVGLEAGFAADGAAAFAGVVLASGASDARSGRL